VCMHNVCACGVCGPCGVVVLLHVCACRGPLVALTCVA
jgi:hypothetical protein